MPLRHVEGNEQNETTSVDSSTPSSRMTETSGGVLDKDSLYDPYATLLRWAREIPRIFPFVQYVEAHPTLLTSVRGDFNGLTAGDFVRACFSHGSTLSNFETAGTSISALSRYATPPIELTREGAMTSLASVESVMLSAEASEYQILLHKKKLLLPEVAELNWSGQQPGRGQHVEYKLTDEIPLEEICLLGCGAYGHVHKVKCRRISLARKSMTCNQRLKLEDAINEVQHLQRFRHAHIVQLVGTYTQGRDFSILMYPVADCDLTTFMKRITKILVQGFESMKYEDYKFVVSLARFFRCLSSAISYIHEQTTKHLDIKPLNILVKCHPRYVFGFNVYVTDFGISRHFQRLDNSQTDGTIAKTPKYCAPEVYEDEVKGRSADIFSLGCVFLEMQTVLCCRILDDFEDHRQTSAYHRSLPRVHTWADLLKQRQPFLTLNYRNILRKNKNDRNRELIDFIKRMLDFSPKNRPTSLDLDVFFGRDACCESARESFQGDDISEALPNYPQGSAFSWKDYAAFTRESVETRVELIATATSNGHYLFLKSILPVGAEPCVPKESLNTALHLAKLEGNDEILQLLIERGAIYLPPDISKETALCVTIDWGNEELVRRLLRATRDEKWSSSGLSHALYTAASREDDGILSVLLQEDLDIDASDSTGWTALHNAASDGNDHASNALLDSGARIEARAKDGSTPLHVAAESGFEASVRLLVDRGADQKAKTDDGETPWILAVRLGKGAAATLLEADGASAQG